MKVWDRFKIEGVSGVTWFSSGTPQAVRKQLIKIMRLCGRVEMYFVENDPVFAEIIWVLLCAENSADIVFS